MANNNDQLDLLLKLLSKGKNAPPKNSGQEELSKYIMNSLSSSQSDLFKKLVSDPKAADDFLKSPQAQEILKKIGKDKI